MIYFEEHLKCYGALSYRRCHWNRQGWYQAWHVCDALYLFIHSFSHECTGSEKSGQRGDYIVNLYHQIQSFDKHFGNEEHKG